MSFVGSAVVAAVVTAASTFVLRGVLQRVRMDIPNERSSHHQPTPRGGGICVALGLVAAYLAAGEPTGTHRTSAALIGLALVLGAVGLADDIYGGISPPLRLGLQFGAAAATISFLVPSVGGSVAWRLLAGVGAFVLIVGYVNAFNFMDGINGISCAQAVAAGVTFAALGAHVGDNVVEWGGLAIAGASVGFLPVNFPSGRVFLGDVGSYLMGSWLAGLAVLAIRTGLPGEVVLAPMALYVADTSTTLLRRIRRGEPWVRAHREHVYQRLADAGWSHAAVTALVFVLIGVDAALGTTSMSDSLVLRIAGDASIVALTLGYLCLPATLSRRHAVGVAEPLAA